PGHISRGRCLLHQLRPGAEGTAPSEGTAGDLSRPRDRGPLPDRPHRGHPDQGGRVSQRRGHGRRGARPEHRRGDRLPPDRGHPPAVLQRRRTDAAGRTARVEPPGPHVPRVTAGCPHGGGSLRGKTPPVGPSAGRVASRTEVFAPSVTSSGAASVPMSVFTHPGWAAFTFTF